MSSPLRVRPAVSIKDVLKAYLEEPAYYYYWLLFSGALGTQCFLVEYTAAPKWKKKRMRHSDSVFVVVGVDGRTYLFEDVPPVLVGENVVRDALLDVPKLRKNFEAAQDVLLWIGGLFGYTFLVTRMNGSVGLGKEIVEYSLVVSRVRMRCVEPVVFLTTRGRLLVGVPRTHVFRVVFAGGDVNDSAERRIEEASLICVSD